MLYICINARKFIIGIIGALITIISNDFIKKLMIDDPVGAIGVHSCSAVWGILAAGLFSKKTVGLDIHEGLFHSVSFYLLGVQLLEIISITSWSLVISFLVFKTIDITIGLRLSEEDEIKGADDVYHFEEINDIEILQDDGNNTKNGNLETNISDINNKDLDNLIEVNNTDIINNEEPIDDNEKLKDNLYENENKSTNIISMGIKKPEKLINVNLPNMVT